MYGRAIRGAIVGYGFIASQGHVPGYAECNRHKNRVEIVAVADGCEARRRRVKQAFPAATVHDDYRRMLDKHAGELDFVDIAVPPAYHAEIARAAVERGLHVLCEKPLTTNLADAISLTWKARKYRRVLFPCHNYRHAPSVRAVREILYDAGGGILMDHGSHTLYLAFEWLGGYPDAVSARAYALDGFDTEDNVSGTFRYPKGIAHCTLSWTAGARKVLYTLHGTKGAIIIDDDAIRVMLRKRTDRLPARLAQTNGEITTDSRWNDASHKEWFADMFADFVAAIDQDAYVGKDASDAVECMNAIEACYTSARGDGHEVCIERPSALADIARGQLLARQA